MLTVGALALLALPACSTGGDATAETVAATDGAVSARDSAPDGADGAAPAALPPIVPPDGTEGMVDVDVCGSPVGGALLDAVHDAYARVDPDVMPNIEPAGSLGCHAPYERMCSLSGLDYVIQHAEIDPELPALCRAGDVAVLDVPLGHVPGPLPEAVTAPFGEREPLPGTVPPPLDLVLTARVDAVRERPEVAAVVDFLLASVPDLAPLLGIVPADTGVLHEARLDLRRAREGTQGG